MAKRSNVRRSRRRPATLQCHWSHGQATVFTGFAWIADGVTESIVIISDDLQHTKLCVYSFVTYILKFLTNKYPAVKNVNILSDGASSQFKQRYLFSNSSIAGTKMIPPPSNMTPQTPSHLPHPTTMRYSDFLDFSWGPVPKV